MMKASLVFALLRNCRSVGLGLIASLAVSTLLVQKAQAGAQEDAALVVAAAKLDAPSVEALLNQGADPNATVSGRSALSVAMQNLGTGQYVDWSQGLPPDLEEQATMVVRLLFAAGAKVDGRDQSLFVNPITRGNATLVRLLVDNGTPLHVRLPGTGYTPAELAASMNKEEIYTYLASHGGAEVAASDAALLRMIQAIRSNDVRWERRLPSALRDGADINGTDPAGRTPLIAAIDTAPCYIGIVKWLLDHGASTNKAARYWGAGKAAIGQPLTALLSNWNSPSWSGYPNADQAKLDLLHLLLSAGAKADAEDEDGLTPLHYAAMANSLLAAQALVEAGASPQARDAAGRLPADYSSSAAIKRMLGAS
jgi:ankyrin repeat protein